MSAPAYQMSSFWLKNVGLIYGLKNRNFWYKFAPKGKFRGPQKKLNIGAQLQTFYYAMTP